MINYFVKLRFSNSSSIMVSADSFFMSSTDIIFTSDGIYTCFFDRYDVLLIYHFGDDGYKIFDFKMYLFPEVI